MELSQCRTATLLVLFGSLALVTAAPVLGPGGHYYDVIYSPGITWTAADASANGSSYLGLQGHLATLTSATEDSFVTGLVLGSQIGEIWAGGFQNPITETVATAGWTWVNGEGAFPGVNSSTPYASWLGGEPNDNYGPGSEQYIGLGLNGNTGWNDEGNLGLIGGYAVEYERTSVPDGGLGLFSLLAFAGVLALGRRVS